MNEHLEEFAKDYSKVASGTVGRVTAPGKWIIFRTSKGEVEYTILLEGTK